MPEYVSIAQKQLHTSEDQIEKQKRIISDL